MAKEVVELKRDLESLSLAAVDEYLQLDCIDTLSKMKVAGDNLLRLKSLKDAIESKRKSYVDPLNKVVRKINAEAKPIRDKVEDAIEHLSSLLREYETAKRLEARNKVQDKVDKLATKGAIQMALEVQKQASETSVISVPGLETRSRRTASVYDIKALCLAIAKGQLPTSAVTPSMPLLNKLTGEVPGVRYYQKTIFARSGQ